MALVYGVGAPVEVKLTDPTAATHDVYDFTVTDEPAITGGVQPGDTIIIFYSSIASPFSTDQFNLSVQPATGWSVQGSSFSDGTGRWNFGSMIHQYSGDSADFPTVRVTRTADTGSVDFVFCAFMVAIRGVSISRTSATTTAAANPNPTPGTTYTTTQKSIIFSIPIHMGLTDEPTVNDANDFVFLDSYVPTDPAGVPFAAAFLEVSSASTVDATIWEAASGNLRVRREINALTILQPPVADAAVTPSSGKTDITSFAFSSTGSTDADGTIVSYAWDFDDGSPVSTATNPSHTYDTAGTYTVTLTVTDNHGLTDTDTVVVTVTDPVPPTAVITTDVTSGKVPLEVAFDGTDSTDADGTIVSYAWDFDDGGTSTSSAPSHTFSTAGTYVVTLTVTDSDGLTDSATVEITVDPLVGPTAVIVASDTEGDYPFAVDFDGSDSTDSDGTIVSYVWSFGDGSDPASGATVSHTFTSPGVYTVTLTVTDDDDLTDDATVSITVSVPDFPARGSWRVPLHRDASTKGFSQGYKIESDHPM